RALVQRRRSLRRLRHAAPRHGRELAHSRRKRRRAGAAARQHLKVTRLRSDPAMESLVHRMPWRGGQTNDPASLVDREWLVTNGLGGYASGTVSGAATRRYHGLLIAALPAPLGRLMMLNP